MQDLVKSNCIVLFLVLLASAIYKTFCEVPNFRNKTFKNTPVVSFGMRGVGAIIKQWYGSNEMVAILQTFFCYFLEWKFSNFEICSCDHQHGFRL